MTMFIADHQLRDFDEWSKLFKANPPPKVGTWRLMRSVDDQNRVYVIGEVKQSDIATVKNFLASERMQDVFQQANAMSKAPIEFLLLEEVTL
jgi:hypothetical protein